MDELQKHILFFDFVENYYIPTNISKNSLNMAKKWNFVKEDKTIVRSSHPPLETIIITCKGDEVEASPFKVAEVNANTPISTEKKKYIYIYIYWAK